MSGSIWARELDGKQRDRAQVAAGDAVLGLDGEREALDDRAHAAVRLLERGADDLGGHEPLPVERGGDGRVQRAQVGPREREADRAGVERGAHDLGVGVGGHDDHGARAGGAQARRARRSRPGGRPAVASKSTRSAARERPQASGSDQASVISLTASQPASIARSVACV